MRDVLTGTTIGAFYATFALHFFACDVNPPSAPTAVTASLAGEASTAQAPTPPARPPDADSAPASEDLPGCPGSVASGEPGEAGSDGGLDRGFTAPIEMDGLTATAILTNHTDTPSWMGIACYGDPRGDIAHQTLDRPVGEAVVDVRQGHSETVSVECPCGVDLQVDTHHGYLEAPVPPYYDAHRHIAVRRLKGQECFTAPKTPRPPDPPEPPGCELTQADCQDGPFVVACACATCPEGTEWDGEECAPKCPDGDVWTDELGGRCCPALPNFPELPTWWGCTG